ncbi:hypothetical protein D3C71_1915630 [compost metagenome]
MCIAKIKLYSLARFEQTAEQPDFAAENFTNLIVDFATAEILSEAHPQSAQVDLG